MIIFIEDLENYKTMNEYSMFIKQYFWTILKDWTNKYIKNIDVVIKIIEVNWTLIPLSIWNNKDNCYTTSMSWTFKYLLLELKLLDNKFFKLIVYLLSQFLFFLIKKSRLDNIIFVNNLLLSTNLYPKLSKQDFTEIKNFLLEKFPAHSILYRSINDLDTYYMDSLNEIWFERLISRQIFISEKEILSEYLKIRDVKNDRNIFEKWEYKFETKNNYSDKELKEILDCYDNLYINKYTDLNPQFTVDFIKNISKNDSFSLNILKNEDDIKAVFWYYKISDVITTPIFWYIEENLYRQISYLLLINTLKTAKILNQSSWVWRFKMNRWAKKYIEYSLIYYKNLPFFKRIIWDFIIFISKTIWEPIFKNNIY